MLTMHVVLVVEGERSWVRVSVVGRLDGWMDGGVDWQAVLDVQAS